jgi:hypothetical protein
LTAHDRGGEAETLSHASKLFKAETWKPQGYPQLENFQSKPFFSSWILVSLHKVRNEYVAETAIISLRELFAHRARYGGSPRRQVSFVVEVIQL